MAATFDDVRHLLAAPNFAHISTLRPDGTILSGPVWCDLDGDEILLNSSEGRAWPANLRRTGTISLSVANAENPYEYASITGRLVGEDHDHADADIDALAKKYLGVDEYPFRRPGEQRVSFRIAPERVFHMNPGAE